MQVILSVSSIRVFSQLEIPYACQAARFEYEGIPTFAPEHFARVRQLDTMKRKAVCQRNQTDCTGRCDPDLPGIQYRYGRDHCRCCRCTAV